MAEIRLSKLTKQFSIGLARLVEFLNEKGANVDMNPNAKISDEYLPAIEAKFGGRTLRNFVLYSIPEMDPRLGDYSFPELCRLVHYHMGAEVTAKKMAMLIATNVSSEANPAIKAVPLFLKNPVMKAVFEAVGERKSCLSLSNLGAVNMPREMAPYVARLDFILGIQHSAPYNCGAISWGNTLYLNFIRNIREPELEYSLYQRLRQLGIPVTVESNNQ